MIRPQRRSFMPGARARVRAMQLLRFSSTSRSQSSSRIWSIAWGRLQPALLTRISTLPSRRRRRRPGGARRRGGSCRRRRIRRGRPSASPNLGGGGRQLVLVAAGDHDAGADAGEDRRHGLAQPLLPPVTRATRPVKSNSVPNGLLVSTEYLDFRMMFRKTDRIASA